MEANLWKIYTFLISFIYLGIVGLMCYHIYVLYKAGKFRRKAKLKLINGGRTDEEGLQSVDS